MTRRHAAAVLLSAGARAWSAVPKRLDSAMGDAVGSALLVDVHTRALIAVHRPDRAALLLLPPGSAIKPFIIEALLRGGKLREGETFPCPGALSIGGRSFNCTHPIVARPVDAETALAYSCNCFVAHFAERFAPGELAAHLARCGLSAETGWFNAGEAVARIERATTREAQQLQAIGEGGVLVTPAEMALAYCRLAVSAPVAIRAGLTNAVAFGTAQRAQIKGASVAGKTGSVRTSDGAMYAWFCGFAPAKVASVAIAVVLEGRSGGADAAPVAGRILEAHFAGRL
jgi:cell division protein FtsI/penicillin-binding protein 2